MKKKTELHITRDVLRSDRYKLFTKETIEFLFYFEQNHFCAASQ